MKELYTKLSGINCCGLCLSYVIFFISYLLFSASKRYNTVAGDMLILIIICWVLFILVFGTWLYGLLHENSLFQILNSIFSCVFAMILFLSIARFLLIISGKIDGSQNETFFGNLPDSVMTAAYIFTGVEFFVNIFIRVLCVLNKKKDSNEGPEWSKAHLNFKEKKILIFIKKILENGSAKSSAAELKQLRVILTEQKVSENIINILDAAVGAIPEAKEIAKNEKMSPKDILIAKQRADARIAREREMDQYRGWR